MKTTEPDAAGSLDETHGRENPADPEDAELSAEGTDDASRLHSEADAAESPIEPGAHEELGTSSETDAPLSPNSDLGSWLSGGLRPSVSKSLPPAPMPASGAALAASSPETLAPQMMDADPLDDDDLAVLPGRGRKQGALGKAAVAALGAFAALLVFGYTWIQQDDDASQAASAAAAQSPVTALPEHEPPAPPAKGESTTALGSTEESDPARAGSARRWVGGWAAPAGEAPEATDPGPRFPGGPSVARFPDLPAAFWSELRQKERQQASPTVQQTAPEDLAGP